MPLYPNQLTQHLKKGLAPFYLLFGDEPQQKLECLQQIIDLAHQQGFEERQVLTVDSQFQWQSLLDATQTMSLFASRQIIELVLPTGKPGAEGSKLLCQLAESPNPDVLLIIHGDKVGRDVQNSKWFKALTKLGVYIPSYPLEGRQLYGWISQRLQSLNLSANPQIVQLLCDSCEGNLLAAKQEIDKLPLLFPDGAMDVKAVQNVIADQSRYTVFQLVDLLLSGDLQKAIRVLYRLESEGIEPVVILWALVREWQTLSQLTSGMQQQQSFAQLCQSMRIWKNRQSLYQRALQRISSEQLRNMQQQLTRLDCALKQSSVFRPYVELCHMCLLFGSSSLENLPIDYAFAS